MKKYLIVYYSRTGHTRTVANELHKMLGKEADLEQIIEPKNRQGAWGYIVGAKDALLDKVAEIKPLNHTLSDYETIILCSPIWASKIANPCNTFLIRHGDQIQSMDLMTLAGASSSEKAKKQIFKDYGIKVGKQVEIKDKDITSGQYVQILKAAGFKSYS